MSEQPIDNHKLELAKMFNLDVNLPDDEFMKAITERVERDGGKLELFKIEKGKERKIN